MLMHQESIVMCIPKNAVRDIWCQHPHGGPQGMICSWGNEHLDEEDVGDPYQCWQIVLLLRQLTICHGLELAVMYAEVGPEITAVG